MECLTSKYAAMKLLSFYIHIKNIACAAIHPGAEAPGLLFVKRGT